jgi:hypothetical protein
LRNNKFYKKFQLSLDQRGREKMKGEELISLFTKFHIKHASTQIFKEMFNVASLLLRDPKFEFWTKDQLS